MKTTKLILAIAFFAFSTMAFSTTVVPDQNEPVLGPRCVKISLEKVSQVRGLTKAIYQQISPRILIFYQGSYTVKVAHNHASYFITGTYDEWKAFFKRALNDDPPER